MTLNDILTIMQNRLISLIEARKFAVNAGDLDKVNQIDADLFTTMTSIDQIKQTLEKQ